MRSAIFAIRRSDTVISSPRSVVNVGVINSILATGTEPANASGLLLYALRDLLCINVLHDLNIARTAHRAPALDDISYPNSQPEVRRIRSEFGESNLDFRAPSKGA